MTKGAGFGFEVQNASGWEYFTYGAGFIPTPQVGMKVMALIATEDRCDATIRTHLLNGALQAVVDSSIKQAGSLVSGEQLRNRL